VLQCVAVCCSGIRHQTHLLLPTLPLKNKLCRSVSQCVAECCGVLQYVAIRCSAFQCVACLQCVAVCCSVLQCAAVCGSARQCVVVHPVCCSMLQCVATTCTNFRRHDTIHRASQKVSKMSDYGACGLSQASRTSCHALYAPIEWAVTN